MTRILLLAVVHAKIYRKGECAITHRLLETSKDREGCVTYTTGDRTRGEICLLPHKHGILGHSVLMSSAHTARAAVPATNPARVLLDGGPQHSITAHSLREKEHTRKS